jgi:hypothetical protein
VLIIVVASKDVATVSLDRIVVTGRPVLKVAALLGVVIIVISGETLRVGAEVEGTVVVVAGSVIG